MSHHGSAQGVRIARKHLSWYTAGLKDSNPFRAEINRIDAPEVVMAKLSALYRAQQEAAPRPLAA